MMKRNQKQQKILHLVKQIEEIGDVVEADNQELYDEVKKFKEQKLT